MRRIADVKYLIERCQKSQTGGPENRIRLLFLQFELKALEAKRDMEAAERCRDLLTTAHSRRYVIVDRIASLPAVMPSTEYSNSLATVPIERRSSVEFPHRLTQRTLAKLKKDLWELALWSVEGQY